MARKEKSIVATALILTAVCFFAGCSYFVLKHCVVIVPDKLPHYYYDTDNSNRTQ